MPNSNILRRDHSPTPFTADEIREGCPEGRTVTSVTETGDGETVTETVRFSGCDEAGTTLGPDDRGRRVSWLDLQAHASFPAADTTITSETIETPLGRLETSRYEVVRGPETLVFWFAHSKPGMPIRQSTIVAGEVTATTTVVADEIT